MLFISFCSAAAFTGNQRVPQNLQLAFGSLKQTQPGSDNFAGRAVPAAVYLACDELIEMITQADARVPGHGASFVCPKFWYKAPHMSITPSVGATPPTPTPHPRRRSELPPRQPANPGLAFPKHRSSLHFTTA